MGIACMAQMLLATMAAMAQPRATPMPLIHTSTGVLFQIIAPGAEQVYLVGTFNGWGRSDGITVSEPDARMLGPLEDGLFQLFVPLTPGRHLFKYCINGSADGWMRGDPSLPTMEDQFDRQEHQMRVGASSMFDFALQEPPWPSVVTSEQMSPVVWYHEPTGRPFLRVRFYSRTATSSYLVGSWDGWAGISYREVHDPNKAMQQAPNYPTLWQGYIPLAGPGQLEYKIVANGREWLSDPSVVEMSDDGNSRITIARGSDGRLQAIYTRRFSDEVQRIPEEYRWSPNVYWFIEQEPAFKAAVEHRARCIWVISMPGQELSTRIMRGLNDDPETAAILNTMVCLETPANLVRETLRQQGINRVPHVILINSNFQVAWQRFNPSVAELKEKLQMLR